MKRIKGSALALLCVALMVACFIAKPDTAFAASDYDSNYQKAESAMVHRPNTGFQACRDRNISLTWSEYITDKSTWWPGYDEFHALSNQIRTSFLDAMDGTGSWGVSTGDMGGSSGKYVQVVWSEDSQLNLQWNLDGTLVALNTHFAIIDCMSSGDIGMIAQENFDDGLSLTISQPPVDYGGGPFYPMSNLFINTTNVNYPIGYEGTQIATAYSPPPPPPAAYVALGDSFSSGEGSFSYYPEQNSCHRSPDSYSHYLKEYIPFSSMRLVACSGAVTDDLYSTSHNNPSVDAQKNHLSENTEVVTLTIGGNDVGFGTVVESCVDFVDHPGYLCSTNLTHQAMIANGMSGLEGAGQTKYTDGGDPIHSYVSILNTIMTAAPNATIYIGGYPRLFGSSISDYTPDAAAPGGAKCQVGNVLGLGMHVSYTDAQWINNQGDLLNGLIEDAVTEINSDKVVYVSPTHLNGHALCDNLYSMINGVIIDGDDPTVESFHPTSAGMTFWGYDFENAMTSP